MQPTPITITSGPAGDRSPIRPASRPGIFTGFPKFHPRSLGLLCMTAALCAACNRNGNSANESGAKRSEATPIQACVVEVRDMLQIREVTSKLESEREVGIFSELAGRAVEVLVEEGDRVARGDILARLDRRDELLALQDAEVSLLEAKDGLTMAELAVEEVTEQVENLARAAEQARRDYGRDLKLSETKDVVHPLSKQALEAKLLESENAAHAEEQGEIKLRRKSLERDGALTAISRSEVALERARVSLVKKDIIAPFDGVISQRNIRVGMSVGSAEAAFILTDTSRLRAVFSRPQEELALFSGSGGRAEHIAGNGKHTNPLAISATAEAYPGREFRGWVERISPTIDADSGQFRVIAHLQSVDDGAGQVVEELLPGMLVRMRIITDRHANTLVVPKRTVRREGDVRYLLRLEGTGEDLTLRRVNVFEGFQDDDSMEVIPRGDSELQAGDRVVLVGSRDLKDGAAVRVVDSSARSKTPDEEPATSELVSDVESGGREQVQ